MPYGDPDYVIKSDPPRTYGSQCNCKKHYDEALADMDAIYKNGEAKIKAIYDESIQDIRRIFRFQIVKLMAISFFVGISAGIIVARTFG